MSRRTIPVVRSGSDVFTLTSFCAIAGGNALNGVIPISGAKNASLAADDRSF
jgi:hypothetical protein